MSDAKPSCAHLVVRYELDEVRGDPGEAIYAWRCELCRTEFKPTIGPALNLSSMTLGDFETAANRLGNAVATIKEAQALLGAPKRQATMRHPNGATVVLTDEEPQRPEAPPDAIAAHRARQFQPPAQDPSSKHPVLSPAEVQQRNALLGRARVPVDPNLPDDIKAAMESE